MAIMEEGMGQEKHTSQLGELTGEIDKLRDEKQALQTRLDGVLNQIAVAHSNMFDVEKGPNPK